MRGNIGGTNLSKEHIPSLKNQTLSAGINRSVGWFRLVPASSCSRLEFERTSGDVMASGELDKDQTMTDLSFVRTFGRAIIPVLTVNPKAKNCLISFG